MALPLRIKISLLNMKGGWSAQNHTKASHRMSKPMSAFDKPLLIARLHLPDFD